MSWNPGPSLGGASWGGSPTIATQNQLNSSIKGVFTTLSTYDFSTISLSTLTIPDWISTSILYVSDIKGANIDISGITIDSKGIFNAPLVSVSSMNLKGFELGLDVNFDFGLGKAIGGVVGGLGALVGGGLIAVGTGAGLAIQGAATGAATLIAGRPQNFISQTNYETINFTTQLQVSTLGYASPVYSSIFRTVSSIAPTQIPGREIFTSTLFYPGQICVRSASDPFNLMSGDSNLNTSTIQSFGQWVALEGLEPDNVVANSVSTNFLSTGKFFADSGYINTFQSFNAKIQNISTIDLKAVNIYASSIIAENITAVSTFFITSTNVEFITSTVTVNADQGIFSSIRLSTIQELGLTSIYNYPGAITAINTVTNTTSPVVGIGFKAQIQLNNNNQPRVDYNYNGMSGTFNGSNFFPAVTLTSGDAIPWSFSNISKAFISTTNTNTISTNSLYSAIVSSASVYALDISSNTLEVAGTINNQNGLLISQEGIFSTILTINGESLNYAAINTNYQSNFAPASMLSSPITSVSTTVLSAYYELDAINTPVYISPGANNTMTLSKLGTYIMNGVTASCNYYGRDMIINPIDNTFKVYTDNGGFGLASNLPVVNLSNNSAYFFGLYINAPSAAYNIPAGASVGVYWNNTGNTFVSTPYYSWPVAAQSNQSYISQTYAGLTFQSPSTVMTNNVEIDGTLSLRGKTITPFIMTWNHTIGFASQHDFGTQDVADGNGTQYNSSEWIMKFSILQINLNSSAYALNAFSMRPNTDVNGYYTISWDTYYTTTMLTSFNISYWADITMYPREMINAVPNKNW